MFVVVHLFVCVCVRACVYMCVVGDSGLVRFTCGVFVGVCGVCVCGVLCLDTRTKVKTLITMFSSEVSW